MADPTTLSTKAPWHLWVVGVLSMLWDAGGAMDFTLTQARNEAYMKAFTPEQLAYFYGFPLWVVASWGIATWGSLLGSVVLLCRKSLAVHVFLVSLNAMGLTTSHTFVLSNGMEVMGGGAGMVIFSAVIFVIAVLLWLYARAMRTRGVLR